MRILDEKIYHGLKMEVSELDDSTIVLLINGEQKETLSEIRQPVVLRSSFIAQRKIADCPCEECKWLVENEDGSVGVRVERLSEDGIPLKSLDALTYAYGGGVQICENMDDLNPIWRKVATV
ncbi:hypothetical protein [Dysgonomonas sp. Marseille-P4361]|uniref:hypothetical protein n=1 Tax=Dysgonomonas sp. Marseille-P4361 TaxID=2161820 RepID=UPI000D54FB7E|nr:hypothetical protein [Dysgonomonas sp. Marseille-P4361]